MARFLWEDGYRVSVCYAGSLWDGVPDVHAMSTECARQYELWTQAQGVTKGALSDLKQKGTVVVDALLGIGADRPLGESMAAWITAVNQAREGGVKVMAVDVPTGVHANTGAVLGVALRADVTATIAYPKTGLLLYPAAICVGRLAVCDIGVGTEALTEGVRSYYLDKADLAALRSRPPYSHKGTFGTVLVIGGCEGMSGAAYLAASSAYRCGAGLVKVLSDEQSRLPLQIGLPEAVFCSFDKKSGPSTARLCSLIDSADCVVLGCGLGTSRRAERLVRRVIRLCQKPLVLDADALNVIAAHPEWRGEIASRTALTVLTPHLKEAAALLQLASAAEVAPRLLDAADELSALTGAICVLKDARSVVSDGRTSYIQTHGNSGMASGGAGDCLAGVIGSLLAQHRQEPTDAVLTCARGVLLHALAGDVAAEQMGQHGMLASDLSKALAEVLRRGGAFCES